MQAMPQVTDGELFMVNTLRIEPEHRDAFLAALGEVIVPARALEGCLLLEAGEVADDPNVVVLTERWKNGNQYLSEYLQLPFYQKYLAASEGVYSAPREVKVLNRL